MNVKPTVHCWGASLTEGTTVINGEAALAPFSSWIPQLTDNRYRCQNAGISGETSAEILDRMRRQESNETSSQFNSGDVVTILCGTNDLGHGFPVSRIMQNVKAMVAIIRDKSARPILMSIPPLGEIWANEMGEESYHQRVALSSQLKELSESVGGGFVDVFRLTGTRKSTPDSLFFIAPQFDADGLHLTPAGYRIVAEAVAQQINVEK